MDITEAQKQVEIWIDEAVCRRQYESFKKYRVSAASHEEFLEEFYKDERYRARGKEYADDLLNSHREHLAKRGYDFITHHDSTRGVIVSFYPQLSLGGKDGKED